MTKSDKKLAAIGGVILVVILLLLFLRRGGATAGNVVSEQSPYDLPAVYGPTLGPIYGSGGVTVSIPGLDLSGPDLSMIGACCSDCMQNDNQFVTPQFGGNTYVFNAPDQGPNIYNYYAPAAPTTPYYAPVTVGGGGGVSWGG